MESKVCPRRERLDRGRENEEKSQEAFSAPLSRLSSSRGENPRTVPFSAPSPLVREVHHGISIHLCSRNFFPASPGINLFAVFESLFIGQVLRLIPTSFFLFASFLRLIPTFRSFCKLKKANKLFADSHGLILAGEPFDPPPHPPSSNPVGRSGALIWSGFPGKVDPT